MRMCLNWKVVGGLAAAGLGLFLAAPDVATAALPLLVLAACPLSMLLMMGAMGGMKGMKGGQCASEPQTAGARTVITPVEESDLARLRARLAAIEAEQGALARAIAEREAARDEDPLRRSAIAAGTPGEPVSGRA